MLSQFMILVFIWFDASLQTVLDSGMYLSALLTVHTYMYIHDIKCNTYFVNTKYYIL